MTTVDHEQSLIRTVFRNSFWSSFTSVAGPVLTFLFGGLTIRYVGIEASGFATALGSLATIVGQFTGLGISDAALPALATAIGAGDRVKVRGIIGIVLATAMLSSCLTAGAIVIFAKPILALTRTHIPENTALLFMFITAGAAILSALSNALILVVRAARRYDLVAKVNVPLYLLYGVIGCTLVPMFPSLLTVALLGCCSSLVSLSIFFPLASRIAPETTRPTLALAEVPALVRCGFWITLSRIVSMMTAGVDDLVITSTCGSAALPPWTICKRAVGTVHAFLAQHVEHLIPTLGSLRRNSQHTFDRLNAAMHWYIVLMAAVSYSCLAWAGPMLIATIAGDEVAQMSRFGLLSVCLNGLAMSLVIMPVISAMAVSDTRPNFILGLLNNVAVLSAIVLLARNYGAPAVYVAAVAVVPSTIMAVGISPTRLFDPGLAWTRIAPVLVPLILGLTAIASTLLFPSTFASIRHAACGAAMAPLLLLMTLGVERTLGMNAELHRQFFRMIRHVLETAGLTRRTMKPAQAARGLD